MRVAVIGAGPSGLVTLKHLITAHQFLDTDPVEAVLFEAEDKVGGTFAHRAYLEAELVSSRQLTTFSDFRLGNDEPDYLPAERYLRYLNDYTTHFQLWPHIKLSSKVVSVTHRAGGGHTVRYTTKEDRQGESEIVSYDCDAIAICSGLHVVPNIPEIEGIEHVPESLHSADFKSKAQFGVDKTLLVMGTGETGMDISYMAVTSPTKRVLLAHNDGFICAPKRVPDPVILPILGNKPNTGRLCVPTDCSTASLFESAYVHPRVHTLLWAYYDFFCKSTLWLIGGSKYGLAQHVGGISKERYHVSKLFFMKSNKAMPYISEPYRAEKEASLTHRIRSSLIQVPIPDTHGRHIDLCPWPERFDENGVVYFRNNGRREYFRLRDEKIRPDMVVFATGYRQTFPFLDAASKGNGGIADGSMVGDGSGISDVASETSTPPAVSATSYATPDSVDTRSIWHSSDPTVGFIGFERPSFGAIPPLAELQAQLWVVRVVQPSALPTLDFDPADEAHYKLKQSTSYRIQYGVDHERYAYQLALDMGAAPSVTEVLRRGREYNNGRNGAWYKLPLVWALGANFNAKFRLRGPWRWEGASGVLVDELWDTIERRGGFFGHVLLSGIPMLVFGSISLICYLLDPLFNVFWPMNGGARSSQAGRRRA